MSSELPKTGRGLSRNNTRKNPLSRNSSPTKNCLGTPASKYYSTQRPGQNSEEDGLLFSLDKLNFSVAYGSREKNLPSSDLAKFTSRNLSSDILAKPQQKQKVTFSKRSTRETIETPYSNPKETQDEQESLEILRRSNSSSHQDETFSSLNFQKPKNGSEDLSYLRGLAETPILSKIKEIDSKFCPLNKEEVFTENDLPDDEDENSPTTLKSLNCFFETKVESLNAETLIFPSSISENNHLEKIGNQESTEASEFFDPKGCFSFRNPAVTEPFTSRISENFEVFPLHFQQNKETSTQLNLRYAECE